MKYLSKLWGRETASDLLNDTYLVRQLQSVGEQRRHELLIELAETTPRLPMWGCACPLCDAQRGRVSNV